MSSMKFAAAFTFGVVVGVGQLSIQSVGMLPGKSPGCALLCWRDALWRMLEASSVPIQPKRALWQLLLGLCAEDFSVPSLSFILLQLTLLVFSSFASYIETVGVQKVANLCHRTHEAHAFLLADATCWCLQQRLMVFSGPGSAGQLSYSLQPSSVKAHGYTYTIILSNDSSFSSHFCFFKK